jgi:hypothetical protein
MDKKTRDQVELTVEIEIEELESKVAPDASDAVLPL